jgi:hypothetical protein
MGLALWAPGPCAVFRLRVGDVATSPAQPLPLHRPAPLGLRGQVAEGNPEGVGEANDVDEADVSLPALDTADVGPMEVRPLGQLLLAEASCRPRPRSFSAAY